MKYRQLRILGTACLILLIAMLSYKNKYTTANSALDNTIDASVMKIDEQKAIIKGAKLKILAECRKLKDNKPQRFIIDGTCE